MNVTFVMHYIMSIIIYAFTPEQCIKRMNLWRMASLRNGSFQESKKNEQEGRNREEQRKKSKGRSWELVVYRIQISHPKTLAM